jgi:hypothetical protein
MEEEKKYTLSEAHHNFAVDFHGQTWDLLEKMNRTQDEQERMLDYAHASLAHWRTAGAEIHHQRGEWLVTRVYTVLGDKLNAMKHALRCLELFETNKHLMADFDAAFTYEAVARACALSGDRTRAKEFIDKSQQAGESIADDRDREAFFLEFNGGEWNGVK